ncbi:hypothetical protein AYO49_05370 [Verrucomicrobiaceae bacterium SCGC AG-212-N21]|nr:hypothetical protein AYO49_05370 [Verrucomicrobiaceae bacterium SCGC AG-212-N21]
MSLLLRLAARCVLAVALPLQARAPLPVHEFEDGHVQKFSTRGHAKAQGLALSLNYPKSWAAFESDRPDVVQKLVADGGNGSEQVLIMITPLTAGATATAEKVQATLSPEGMKQFLPKDATFLRATNTTFAKQLAGVLEYFTPNEKSDTALEAGKGNGKKQGAGVKQLDTHTVSCMFVRGDRLVQVQFQIIGTEYSSSESLTGIFRPLWNVMMFSIEFAE